MSKEKVSAIIYGAGTGGKRAYKFYKSKYNIRYFIDSDSRKWGNKISGIKIVEPSKLIMANSDLIIIASQSAFEIYRHLRDLGVRPERIEVAEGHILVGENEIPWVPVGVAVFLIISFFTYLALTFI